MNVLLLLACCLIVTGCSYGAEKFRNAVDDPITLLEDPLTVSHKDAMADLEKSYLKKDITYAEYLERRKGLEEDYAKEVQDREELIDER